MADAILTINAGSSSIKVSAFADAEQLFKCHVEALATLPRFRASDARGGPIAEKSWGSALSHAEAIDFVLSWCRAQVQQSRARLVGAGHRVVHGGTEFGGPALIDEAILAKLAALTPLAPLHQPHNLAAIEAMTRLAPDLPQVARFDTAFHRTQPELAQMFAIPRGYFDAGVRRYGFHGLSYEYVAAAMPSIDPVGAAGRTIVAHLGNGASLCAMRNGRSVATTMGLTALDGLVMGTRCGAIDPGVLLYLSLHAGMSAEKVQRLLYEESGLLGVSGISGDMRTLLASDDSRARRAVDLFVYRAAGEIGSLAAALGGVDAVVFTGGIGENSPPVRSAIGAASRWLGLEIDESENARGGPRISATASRIAAWVVPTNEELMIARHTARLLAGTDQGRST